MIKIERLLPFRVDTMINSCNLLFDKQGLEWLNRSAGFWRIDESLSQLHNPTTNVIFKIEKLNPVKVGDKLQICKGYVATIESINLKRLSSMLECEAMAAGVQCFGHKKYKHYCPELFFPKTVLKDQQPGFPFMNNAVASFNTLWIKKYGITEMYLDPWIWQYEFKIVNRT